MKSIPHCTKQCRNIRIFNKNVECHLPGLYLVQKTISAAGVINIRITQNMTKITPRADIYHKEGQY